MLLAVPFVLGETTWDVYLKKSKLTGAGAEGYLGRAKIYDYMASSFDSTITWGWLSDDLYNSGEPLRNKLMGFMLFANVWFFFVRKNLLPACLNNLFNSFSSTKIVLDHARKATVVEVMIVLWMVGCMFMPGAHLQFQLWYNSLVPVVLFMTNLPGIFVSLIYLEVFAFKPDWWMPGEFINVVNEW